MPVPTGKAYARSVFINCPFSPKYKPIFRAILFSIYSCGFTPLCALEISDSSQNRLSKIEDIIQQSKFGIHDISYVEIDARARPARVESRER
jgi:hypothetical protein